VNELAIDFHAELYPREALERAAAAYAPLAEVAIERHGAYHRALIRARQAPVAAALRHEFANFVLASCAVGASAG
jgi:hypothetical protein